MCPSMAHFRVILEGLLVYYLCVILVIGALGVSSKPLTKFIRDYETLDYDLKAVLGHHRRAKRSPHDTHIPLKFFAHGRQFNLRLNRDLYVHSPDLIVESAHGPIHHDPHRAYTGKIEGERLSYVHGILTRTGHFEGKIILADDIWVIEKASRYFPSGTDYHSVIYKTSDIDFDMPSALCHSDKIHEKFKQSQVKMISKAETDHSAGKLEEFTGNHKLKFDSSYQIHDENRNRKFEEEKHGLATHSNVFSSRDVPSRNSVYSIVINPIGNMSANMKTLEIISIENSTRHNMYKMVEKDREEPGWKTGHNLYSRRRRAVSTTDKTVCELYLQADHLFYEHYGKNTETVMEQLTQHVQAVNAIYRQVDFDKDNHADNIGFIIKKIKIHTDSTALGYRYAANYGVEKFLELVSAENYDFVCLSYMFTYRDFEGGTLGLAWTADVGNAGGICETYKTFSGEKKSLNTGIVTVLNYGQYVPPTVSHVTLAHEIGHNMGSPHDPATTSCSPGGGSGNYIMYARATSGGQSNNDKFSSCSVNNMGVIISNKGRGTSGCFTEYTEAVCGNKIVEEGEECDCGWEEECIGKCCNPQTSNSSAPKGCTLKQSALCSPSEGLCCNADCTVVLASQNQLCRSASSCQDAAYCDGANYNATCPPSIAQPNKTTCGESSICYKGECTGSLCQAYGLESCQCSGSVSGDWKDEKLCQLCCKKPGQNEPCRSSFDWNDSPYNLPDTLSQPGTPCFDYQGFCDVFHKCREVDPSGPIQNIQKLLFSDQGIATIKQWLQTYWYIVVLGGIAFIVLMVVFVKVCSKSSVGKMGETFELKLAKERQAYKAWWQKHRSKNKQVAPQTPTSVDQPV